MAGKWGRGEDAESTGTSVEENKQSSEEEWNIFASNHTTNKTVSHDA